MTVSSHKVGRKWDEGKTVFKTRTVGGNKSRETKRAPADLATKNRLEYFQPIKGTRRRRLRRCKEENNILDESVAIHVARGKLFKVKVDLLLLLDLMERSCLSSLLHRQNGCLESEISAPAHPFAGKTSGVDANLSSLWPFPCFPSLLTPSDNRRTEQMSVRSIRETQECCQEEHHES